MTQATMPPCGEWREGARVRRARAIRKMGNLDLFYLVKAI
jgi:hypothetical protein